MQTLMSLSAHALGRVHVLVLAPVVLHRPRLFTQRRLPLTEIGALVCPPLLKLWQRHLGRVVEVHTQPAPHGAQRV